MTRLTATFQAILERCVLAHGMAAPITLEVVDAEGNHAAARYCDDRGPELLEGRPGGVIMQPPLGVYAYDEHGRTAGFTLQCLGPGKPTVH